VFITYAKLKTVVIFHKMAARFCSAKMTAKYASLYRNPKMQTNTANQNHAINNYIRFINHPNDILQCEDITQFMPYDYENKCYKCRQTSGYIQLKIQNLLIDHRHLKYGKYKVIPPEKHIIALGNAQFEMMHKIHENTAFILSNTLYVLK
jgi:hypothetical protein